MSSIARAVWRNDVLLARNLLLRSHVARQHITINASAVGLADSQAFADSQSWK